MRSNAMFRLTFLTPSLLMVTFGCGAVAAQVQSEPVAVTLDSLVVTAARAPQASSELVADVTVITKSRAPAPRAWPSSCSGCPASRSS
jgi:outer membrane cobalamin receptor